MLLVETPRPSWFSKTCQPFIGNAVLTPPRSRLLLVLVLSPVVDLPERKSYCLVLIVAVEHLLRSPADACRRDGADCRFGLKLADRGEMVPVEG